MLHTQAFKSSLIALLCCTPTLSLAEEVVVSSKQAFGETAHNKYPVIPAGGLLISLETPYHFGINLVAIPTIKSIYLEGFVAAQFKIHF